MSSLPINPGQPFPDPSQLEGTLFPQGSRYHGLKVRRHVRDDGKEVAYVERRILPEEDEFEEVRLHTVTEGDRLDLIAFEYLGDAEQAWQIADANGAMNPEELTAEIGRRIKITLPQGMQGSSGGNYA